MISDTNLDKLIKETIGENLVKDPGKEFTFQTVKAIGNFHAATKPLISGKQIGIFLLKEENAEKLVIYISQIIDFVRKNLGPRSLLYKFLSIPEGIHAMQVHNWLQPELEYWITEGWLAYAK